MVYTGNKHPLCLVGIGVIVMAGLGGVASAQDSDGDGVPNPQDAFPCNASVSGEAFAPAQGAHGTVLFEDKWPERLDDDYNDVVVTYNQTTQVTATGATMKVRLTYNVLAAGGTIDVGLGLVFPVAASQISGVSASLNGAPLAIAVAPEGTNSALLTLTSDIRSTFFGTTTSQIINASSLSPRVSSLGPLQVTISLSQPTMITQTPPYDLFIFRTQAPSHEVHLIDYCGTSRFDSALFGTGIDVSTPARCFVDAQGLPAVMTAPQVLSYPGEGVNISSVYPNIVPWAVTGGNTNFDWLLTPTLAAAYPNPLAPAFVAGPTFSANLTCGCPSGFTGTIGNCTPVAPTCNGLTGGTVVAGPITTSPPTDFTTVMPAAGMSDDGSYTVVWTSNGTPPFAAFAQQYDPSGASRGQAVQVSPYPSHFVTGAADVAMNATGGSVITYTSVGTAPFAVYSQRYDNTGAAIGIPVQVSPYPLHFVTGRSAVAMNATGEYVVAWSNGTAPFAAFFQRYDASGVAQGGPVQASPYPGHFVTDLPDIAIDDAGNVAVAWVDGGSTFAIHVQLFDAMSAVVGPPIRSSPSNHFVTSPPAIGMAGNGDFAVAWNDTSSTFSVFTQPYGPTGHVNGAMSQANETGFISGGGGRGGPKDAPQTLSMDDSGSYIVGWKDGGATHRDFVRRFDVTGAPIGSEQMVHGSQFTGHPPAVATAGCSGAQVAATAEDQSFTVIHSLLQ